MSIQTAVQSDRLAALKALRDHIAGLLDSPDTAAREVAALARQLRETLKDIAELERAAPKGSKVDELARRRKARLAKTPSPRKTTARKTPAKRQRTGGGRTRS